MKRVMAVSGVVLVLLGLLWILQGTNILPTGFMAGHLEYAGLGAVALVIGTGLLLLVNRRGSNA